MDGSCVHCLNGKKKCWALDLCDSEMKRTSAISLAFDKNAPITIKHPSQPLRRDVLDYKSAVICGMLTRSRTGMP